MTSFLALYRGDSVSTAQLVTVCADRDLVARFARQMLDDSDYDHRRQTGDGAVDSLRDGRRKALELIRAEANQESRSDEDNAP